ncbi:12792_t:CDS:2 [Ambispora leptoticha]|uniref:12792_t:CDS:1 n=1 Tax=Ambispora leptoticha TaxID=144679 RepID=A0A9N8VK73_9GLOM|nr:12792_t:CDS:2 [Ambispora leptoticha]
METATLTRINMTAPSFTASVPQKPRSHLFTCLACQVAFPVADLQREHYGTDWHRYNLKRKVAELPPVTAEVFAQKVLAQQVQNRDHEAKASFSAACDACGKTYYSENAYANHLQSNKHKLADIKAAQNGNKQSKKPLTEGNLGANNTNNTNKDVSTNMITEETTDAELQEIIDKKIASAVKLTELDCLFCVHKSSTFELNLKHMTKAHSFFIPDIEYLVDLRGLIKYLGEKITVGNICLFCNGRGRGLRSLEAIDKGHCMLAYDREEDIMDIVDYYDFTSSYPDEEWEDVEDDEEGEDEEILIKDTSGEISARNLSERADVFYTDNETELILPSGARIGHRSLRRYYKQYLRPRESREKATVNRLLTDYSRDFGYKRTSRTRESGIMVTHPANKGGAATRVAFKDKRRQHEFDVRVGIKANKLQRHFRAQTF